MASRADDEELGLLAAVSRSARAVRRDLAELRRSAFAALRAAPDLFAWMRRLPTLRLDLTVGSGGGAVLHGLSYCQPWPARFRAVGVISLPASFEEYLAGRSKQAVRTNRRRASTIGLAAFRTDSVAESRKLLDALVDHHQLVPTMGDRLAGYVASSAIQMWCVVDPNGQPIGMAAVAVDGPVAQLTILQIATDIDDRSAARFLLSTEIIHGLIDEGRQHLLADSLLLTAPGVAYLQQRLGFVPTRIVVPWRPFDRTWRRTARNVRRTTPSVEPHGVPET